nr:hypothetical protein [Tanacetum cinerariifolium]
AGNPVTKVLLKLIISVHRIRRWCYNLILVESKFKTPCSIIKDKYMMKAQVHVLKSSAISDVQALPRRKYFYYQVRSLCRLPKNKRIVGNKMHKAFPLPGESFHWQYKFPLPVKVVPTARRLEMPLPEVCTAIEEMVKKLPVKDRWQLH